MKMLTFLFTALFFSSIANSQPIVVNERWWSVGAEAGLLSLHNDYNPIVTERNLPNGLNFGISGAYSWKQDNNRITRFGVGIRYEYMNDYRISVPSLKTVNDNYTVDKQSALSLKLDGGRIIPFTPTSSVYSLFGAYVNVTLISQFTGKHNYSAIDFSKTEIYKNYTDPNRKPVSGGLYAGLGMAITDKLRAEIQVNAGFPPILYYKLSAGAQATLHYAIGESNTKERKIYTPN